MEYLTARATPMSPVLSEGTTKIEDIDVPEETKPLGKSASQDDLLNYLHDILDETDEK
jgi:hypothetical protein